MSPGPDLFAAAVEERLASRAPLAARLRPRSLDEVVGQQHLLGPGKPLRVLIESDRLSSVILWGPPGTGKTTIARLVAGVSAKAFETLSRGERGREGRARGRRAGPGPARRARPGHDPLPRRGAPLLPRAAGRAAPVRRGGSARARRRDHREPVLLAHRSAALAQHAVPPRAARRRRPRASSRSARSPTPNAASATKPTEIDDDALEHLVDKSEGDARHLLTVLEVAHALAVERRPRRRSRSTTRRPRSRCAACSYGDDEHYDIVSAFIKSIRGSDPDAGLYWLARMLEAGEDARFIARRLVILASEDIGLADPQALLVADAAARAVEYVGLPEAAINLAHAVIHLALAPKSNSVIERARRGHGGGPRPPGRAGPDAPARLALPRRPDARSRRGLRLSSRRSAGLGAAGAPAGRGGRRAVLPAELARRGAGVVSRRWKRARTGRDRRATSRRQVTMSAGDVLAVVAATVVTMLVAVLAVDARRARAHVARAARHRRRRSTTKRSPLLEAARDAVERRRDRGRPGRAARHVGRAAERRGRRRVAHRGAHAAFAGREGDGVRHRRVACRAAAARGRDAAARDGEPPPPPAPSAKRTAS